MFNNSKKRIVLEWYLRIVGMLCINPSEKSYRRFVMIFDQKTYKELTCQ